MNRFVLSWDLFWSTMRLWSTLPLLWFYGVFSIGVVWAVWWPFSEVIIRDAMASDMNDVASVVGPVEMLIGFLVFWFVNLLRVTLAFIVVDSTLSHLEGDSPSLEDASAVLVDHIESILGLSFINTAVSYALDWIKERSEWLGRFMTSIVEMIWVRSTALTISTMVTHPELSLQEGYEESLKLFKRTWGENLIAATGLGLANSALMIVTMLVWTVSLAFIQMRSQMDKPLLQYIFFNGCVMIVLAFSILGELMDETFNAVLYRYASCGEVAEPFDTFDLKNQYSSR